MQSRELSQCRTARVGLFRSRVFQAVFLLTIIASTPQLAFATEENPLDGMSAIEIAVQADLARADLPQQVASGTCTDSLDQVTSVQLSKFAFAKLTGRAGHESLTEIESDPLPGEIDAIAELWGPWSTAEFRLVNEQDEQIQPLTMISADDEFARMYWTGSVNVPNEPFRVAVSGTDESGTAFDIICDYLFTPQTVEVVFDVDFQHSNPGPLQLHATVTNHGPLDTFNLDYSNDMDLPVSGSDSSVELSQGGSAEVVLTLDIPAVSIGVLEAIAKIAAHGTTNPTAINQGTSRVRIEKFDFLFGSGFDRSGGEVSQ